jgi:glycosyltransferase involved in cell wall biosynthesis
MTLHDYKLVCPRYDMLRHGHCCDACVETGPAACLRYRCAGGSWLGSLALYSEATLHRLRGTYDSVQLFLAPSRFLFGMLLRAGFDPARLRYLPNGVPGAPGDAAARPGRGVYAGRLSPEKGVETLVRAAAGVEGLELVVCGDGPLRARLEALAASAPPGRIQLRGHLESAALQEELAAAAFVAVPSEWYENAPFAALEAMAMGRAVLASRLGGLPELVHDGETGVLLPPGDVAAWSEALRAAVAAPEALRAYGARARQEAEERFSFGAQVTALESIYHEVQR